MVAPRRSWWQGRWKSVPDRRSVAVSQALSYLAVPGQANEAHLSCTTALCWKVASHWVALLLCAWLMIECLALIHPFFDA